MNSKVQDLKNLCGDILALGGECYPPSGPFRLSNLRVHRDRVSGQYMLSEGGHTRYHYLNLCSALRGMIRMFRRHKGQR